MQINKLILKDFRNFKKAEVLLDRKLVVLVGNNAMGKTNFLEALFVISTTKSLKASREQFLIRENQDYAQIICEFKKQDKINEIISVIEKNENRTIKKWRLNKIIKSSNKIAGELVVVIFRPDELDLLAKSASERRNLIDHFIIKKQSEYLIVLKNLKKVLVQRQAALEQIRKGFNVDLESLDVQLIKYSSLISFLRQKLINEIKQNYISQFCDLADHIENIDIFLGNNLSYEIPNNKLEEWKNFYQKALLNNKQKEIESGRNLVGSQRDDLIIKLDKRLLREFGSRGEWRTSILALKFSELEYFYKLNQEHPILLLDDVFSELDKVRRNKLIKKISNQQTILTTTNDREIDHPYQDYYLIKVKEGQLFSEINDYSKT